MTKIRTQHIIHVCLLYVIYRRLCSCYPVTYDPKLCDAMTLDMLFVGEKIKIIITNKHPEA